MTVCFKHYARFVWQALALTLLAGVTGCAQYANLSWSLFEVTPAQEQELGKQVAAQVEQKRQPLRDPEVNAYIQQVGARIARSAPRGEIAPRFYVVPDPSINAFAIPGGNVYVQTGLIEAADNEAELAAVIAHEVGHVIGRHSAKQVANATGLQAIQEMAMGEETPQIAQIVASLATQSGMLYYSREAESEADEIAVRTLYNAGYDPRALRTFFQKLLDKNGDQSEVQAFFASHPPTSERMADVDAMVSQLPARRYTNDVTALRRVQGRLQELGLSGK